MTYLDFMRERLGADWVLARRTSRILRQYGDDVNCITAKQLRKVERDYRALFGDPYDKPRAAMWLALKRAKRVLEFMGTHLARADYDEICAAIDAERASFTSKS